MGMPLGPLSSVFQNGKNRKYRNENGKCDASD
jgi:hypothetical protein